MEAGSVMHEHADKKCEHELKFCAHCDTVYCEKCKREWKTPVSVFDSRLKDYVDAYNNERAKKDRPYRGDPPKPWVPQGPVWTTDPDFGTPWNPARITCHGDAK